MNKLAHICVILLLTSTFITLMRFRVGLWEGQKLAAKQRKLAAFLSSAQPVAKHIDGLADYPTLACGLRRVRGATWTSRRHVSAGDMHGTGHGLLLVMHVCVAFIEYLKMCMNDQRVVSGHNCGLWGQVSAGLSVLKLSVEVRDTRNGAYKYCRFIHTVRHVQFGQSRYSRETAPVDKMWRLTLCKDRAVKS